MIITPWTKAKMQKNFIVEVSKEKYDELFTAWESEREMPIYQFFYIDGNTVIAVDNLRGCFWQEEFKSVSKAVKWLAGEAEVEKR